MKHSVKTTTLVLALLSAALVTPAYANGFRDGDANTNWNLGSAPNPTPRSFRENRSPDYPLISRVRNEEGTVGLTIWLTELGAVSRADVDRTSGYSRLDDAAVQYVKAHWLHQPTNNQIMPATVQVDVSFKLN